MQWTTSYVSQWNHHLPPPQGCPCHCLTYDLSVSTFVSSLVRHLNLHHLSSCCALHQCLESASLAFWLLAFFLDGDKKQHWWTNLPSPLSWEEDLGPGLGFSECQKACRFVLQYQRWFYDWQSTETSFFASCMGCAEYYKAYWWLSNNLDMLRVCQFGRAKLLNLREFLMIQSLGLKARQCWQEGGHHASLDYCGS